MSAAHTPGPWVAELGGNGAFAIEADKQGATGGLLVIASRNEHPLLADQMHANARLIAEAPDLLAALSDLLEAAESMLGTCGCIRGDTPEDADTHTHDEWAEAFLRERAALVRAAIAKATGGAA